MSDKLNLLILVIGCFSLAQPLALSNRGINANLGPTVRQTISSFQNNVNNVTLIVSYINHQIAKLNTQVEVECDICKVVVTYLKALVDTNSSEATAVNLITTICADSQFQTPAVCQGAMESLVPEIMFIYKSIKNKISIDNICAFVIVGACGFPPTFVPTFDWRVTFPTATSPPISASNPKAPKSIVKIVHISDTHWDKEYVVGAINNCVEPLCCRDNVTQSGNGTKYLSGTYGGLNGGCDIPFQTLESAFRFIHNNISYNYIYWTGDVPPHDYYSQSKAENLDIIQSTADLVKSYFSQPNTVFATCGNHEANPIDSYPVPLAYDKYDISYLYSKLYTVWSNFLPDVNQSSILKGGYYAFDIQPTLRLISLNTNYCLRGNFFVLMQLNDPTGELQWLIQQLDECEKKNIKAHIIGHIPPGWCSWFWARNYRDILVRYKNVISGHFYGHTHNDEFEVVYNDEISTSSPISVAFIGPSITTYTNVNPSFRVYSVDNVTWSVLDYDEYYMDVNIANSVGYPEWKLLYTAKSFYNMPDLSATSYNNLISKIATNDTLFQQFYRNFMRVPSISDCTGTCKSNILCSLQNDWPGRNVSCSTGLAQTF